MRVCYSRDHRQVIQSCLIEKQHDLQPLPTSYFHGTHSSLDDDRRNSFFFVENSSRLNSRIGNPSMQVIQEENHADDEQQTYRATSTKQRGKN